MGSTQFPYSHMRANYFTNSIEMFLERMESGNAVLFAGVH